MPVNRKERWSVTTHNSHYIKDLTAPWALTDCKGQTPVWTYQCLWVNLAAQTSMCALQKYMPEEEELVPGLMQGKYKLGLEKQDVLVCHKESDPRIMETCQKQRAGRGSTGQIQDNSWLKIMIAMDKLIYVNKSIGKRESSSLQQTAN